MHFGILGSRGFPSTYGGYETLVRYLARAFVQAGHEVTVYCRGHQAGRRHWITEGVNCVATAGVDTKSFSTLSYGLTSTLHALRYPVDAMLVLNIANGYFVPLLRARGIPVAVNTDGIEWQRGKWGPLARCVFRGGARMTATFATELVCDSRAIGRIWEHEFGRSSTFIPYGAPLAPRGGKGKLEGLGLSPESYLLVVARLIPENNVDLTLDALDLLGARAPKAVVVGSASGDSHLTRRLSVANRSGQLMWLGHVDDQELLEQLWVNCSLYVHGHSVGGTNPALLQALGNGAPTIALSTPYNREVLESDTHLYPMDARILADRIAQVQSSERVRSGLKEHGRAVVQARYSWNQVCAKYMELFERLGKDGGTRVGVVPAAAECSERCRSGR